MALSAAILPPPRSLNSTNVSARSNNSKCHLSEYLNCECFRKSSNLNSYRKNLTSSYLGAKLYESNLFSPQRFANPSPSSGHISQNPLRVRSAIADVAQNAKKGVGTAEPGKESWVVHKFGGTCVANSERIKNVAKIVSDENFPNKFVIVSAMSKVTDMMYRLLSLAESKDDLYLESLSEIYEKHRHAASEIMGEGDDLETFLANLEEDIQNLKALLRAIYIAGNATDAFSDFVAGHGELWSAQILAAAVRKHSNAICTWLDARKVLVVNPIRESNQQVDPDYEVSEAKLRAWLQENPSYKYVIATGFIASTPEGIPTTLKRDGSDFSAAIFGSLLRAKQVTIWTDVNGVYSADPRKVNEAVVLKSLSYQEAWEMSYFGANVLHPRTTLPVMKYNIPMIIRNVFDLSSSGTMIGHLAEAVEDQDDKQLAAEESDADAENLSFEKSASYNNIVKGFATIDNIALINVEGTGMAGVPGTASEIFASVKDVGANVIAISQASSEHSVCFAVPESEATVVASALQKKFQRALDAGRISKVEIIPKCSVLAAVGQKMASTPGVSATLFGALAKANINVRMIAQGCSEYNITVIVNEEDSIRALKAVHSRFYLSKTSLAVGIIGPGLIGKTLLNQLKTQVAKLKEEFNIDLRILGIMGSKKMLLSESGIDLSVWDEEYKNNSTDADLEKFSSHIQNNSFIPNNVIIDCTANESIARYYFKWLSSGMHIITPNKKLNSGPLNDYLKLREMQRKTYTHYFYEATVGAGLPIISTLRGLLETGDRVLKIEGIFSGTLSYIFNNFSNGKKFSDIVLEAKENGYTEPDPRDDLSGTDVARKVIILARECGLRLELKDIPVQSLVPKALQNESSENYLVRLPEFDNDMLRMQEEAEAEGDVLRYVGVVDAEANEGRVELRRYPKSHPFAQLSGSDNIIAFTTVRYRFQPLIVRGPGAGAEVTAGGVFCDLLRLASYLGAPS